MDELEAKGRLSAALVIDFEATGFTHDLAARVIHQDSALPIRFHIVADEPGFGPVTSHCKYQSVLRVLEDLAEIGSEKLRFLPDGGIEFYPIAEDERIDWLDIIRRLDKRIGGDKG